jgi:hypothetical protein
MRDLLRSQHCEVGDALLSQHMNTYGTILAGNMDAPPMFSGPAAVPNSRQHQGEIVPVVSDVTRFCSRNCFRDIGWLVLS